MHISYEKAKGIALRCQRGEPTTFHERCQAKDTLRFYFLTAEGRELFYSFNIHEPAEVES